MAPPTQSRRPRGRTIQIGPPQPIPPPSTAQQIAEAIATVAAWLAEPAARLSQSHADNVLGVITHTADKFADAAAVAEHGALQIEEHRRRAKKAALVTEQRKKAVQDAEALDERATETYVRNSQAAAKALAAARDMMRIAQFETSQAQESLQAGGGHARAKAVRARGAGGYEKRERYYWPPVSQAQHARPNHIIAFSFRFVHWPSFFISFARSSRSFSHANRERYHPHVCIGSPRMGFTAFQHCSHCRRAGKRSADRKRRETGKEEGKCREIGHRIGSRMCPSLWYLIDNTNQSFMNGLQITSGMGACRAQGACLAAQTRHGIRVSARLVRTMRAMQVEFNLKASSDRRHRQKERCSQRSGAREMCRTRRFELYVCECKLAKRVRLSSAQQKKGRRINRSRRRGIKLSASNWE